MHEAAQGRYRMLETIRQFAWDKLVEASEDQALRARHRDWCLALAEAAEFTTPAATAWLARLAAEQDNSGRPWSGTAPPVTMGPSGCGWVGRCGSSGGPRRSRG